MDSLIIAGVFVGLFALFVFPYVRQARRRERANRDRLAASEAAGLNEPPTLHPVVDPAICLGSGACVAACPEGDILGLINGRPVLLNASRCVGHGECAAACPVEAISLVFGTARRGVDIPHVKGNFETNVPRIYIAGELGGMGLIRNALRQGRQTVEGIAALGEPRASGDCVDVLVAGAGPAGMAAALTAKEQGLSCITVEQELPGGAVRHYPRQKLVMTEPMDIPLYGKVSLPQANKEELLGLWKEVIDRTGLEVRSGERLVEVRRENGLYRAVTTAAEYHARRIVLAIGRRGTPRRLGVPGEDLDKVAYRLLEPEHFHDACIAVVGGGNAAAEVAWALASQGRDNRVTLVHRSAALARANQENRQRVDELCTGGELELLLNAEISAIRPDEVDVDLAGEQRILANDFVFVCVGGELPVPFLQKLGVSVQRKFGEA
jgi:thioredoxin reductase (NADPH)